MRFFATTLAYCHLYGISKTRKDKYRSIPAYCSGKGSPHCDCVLINGGNFRGERDYKETEHMSLEDPTTSMPY